MNVPSINNLHYSFYPGHHYLVDDDGNVIGCFPAVKEVSLFKQKFIQVKNIRWWIGEHEN